MTPYPLVKFGDVVRQVKDKVDPQTAGLERFIAGEHMDTDNLHIRRWGDVGAGYLGPAFHMRFKPGQVLYGSRRTYLRKVAVAEFEGITANTTYVIESKDPDVLLPELLPFIMQTDSFNEHSIKQSKGSVNPYINFSDITWYEFPLPPVDEQRRIADLLWAADDAIQEKSNLMSSLLALMDSLREEIFFSSDASKVKLKEIAEVRYGLGQPPPKTDSGVPLIRATNISQGQISKKDLLLVNPDDLPASRAIYLQEGDIILVRSGAYTGDSAMITGEWVNSIAGYDLVVIPDKEKIHPVFLAEFLLHRRTVKTILTPLSARSAQPHINAVQVGGIEITLPSMKIQLEKIEKLNQVNQTISELRNNTELLKRTKKLLLEQSLS